ncbi:MAG: hypothetical protein ACTSUT_02225 [Promethearchaeota archaeon]
MNKKLKLLILFCVAIGTFLNLLIYFYCKRVFEWHTFELKISRMMIIISFSILFQALIFFLEIDLYKKIFISVFIIGAPIWLIVITINLFKVNPYTIYNWDFWDLTVLFSFSIVSSGLLLFIIYYVINITLKYEGYRIFGKYRVHEGFIGTIFIIIAGFLFILYSLLVRYSVLGYFMFLKNVITFLRSLNLIFLFFFLYIGSFFIIRDWQDIVRFKLIEKNDNMKGDTNQNNQNNHFFEFPKLTLYPFGLILTNFAVNAIAYGKKFLPVEFFNLKRESIALLGFSCCIAGGLIIGRDWFRICKKFYPELYQKIELKNKLDKAKKVND